MTADWRSLAACDGHAPLFDAFIDFETARQREVRHRAAKAICKTCAVITACGQAAVLGVDEGIRAGQLMPEAGALHMAKWRAAQNRQETA